MRDHSTVQELRKIEMAEIYGDVQNVARIFHLFIAVTLTGLLGGILIGLTNDSYVSAAILAGGVVPALVALYLARQKRFEAASVLLAILFLVMNTALSTNGLGIHSVNNLVFPTILIIASMVSRRRTMFFLTALTVICLGWLVFGEVRGVYSPGILVQGLPRDFYSSALIVILTAIMIHRLTGEMYLSFIRMQQEALERKVAQENLRQRETILEAVTFAAEQFIKSSDWRASIERVLEQFGRTIDASHAYLFEHHVERDNRTFSSMRYEWTAPGYPSDLNNPEYQATPLELPGFESYFRALRSGEPFIGNISTFLPAERDFFTRAGIKSMVEVPLIVDGKWWGTIGFDDFENERKWSNGEVDALRIAAGVLGAAIQRQKADSALQESERIYRQAIEAAGAVPYYQDYEKREYTFFGEGIRQIAGIGPGELTPLAWDEMVQEVVLLGELAGLDEENAAQRVRAGEMVAWKCDYRILTPNGQSRWVADTAVEVFTDQKLSIGSIGIMQDITDRKMTEAALRQREAILESITFTAEQFLKSSDWRAHINTALERLGRSLDVTHSYLFEHHLDSEGVEVSSLRYEWTAAGFSSFLDDPHFQTSHLLRNEGGTSDAILQTGEVFMGNSSTFPQIEKDRLAEMGVKAMLEVPLFVNGAWWGTIGFDDMVNEREWSPPEVDALKVAAGILSAAIRRELAESAVRESERIYRQAISAAGAVPYYRDYQHNRYLFMGEGIENIIGYKPEEVTVPLWQSIMLENVPLGDGLGLPIDDAIQRSRTGALKVWKSDMRVKARSGEERWVTDSAVELFNDAEMSYASVGILQDVTDRKHTEAGLRKRESNLEASTFAAEQFLKTPDWRSAIDAVLERLGREFNASHAYLFEKHPGADGTMVGSLRYEWTAPGQRSDMDNPIYQNAPAREAEYKEYYEILDSGEPFVGNTISLREFESERVWMESTGIKALLEMRIVVDGKQWGTLGFDDMVSEREWTGMEVDVLRVAANVLGAAIKRQMDESTLQQELAERKRAEQKYRDIFNNSIDGIFQSTEDGRFLSVNPAMARIYRYESPEKMLTDVKDIVNQLYVNPEQRQEMRRRLASGERLVGFESLDYRRDGSTFWASMSAQAIFDESGQILYYEGTVEDITPRKKAEEEREALIQELAKKNAEAETLRETTSIVTSTLDVTEAVQRILEQLKRAVPYDSASVWLYVGEFAYLMGSDGLSDEFDKNMKIKIDAGEPDYRFVVEDVPYILLDDVQEQYPQFRTPPSSYIHGWLSVPLKARGNLIGFISLDSRTPGRFTELDARLALNFANQVAVALENARLFSDLQKELEERKKLIEELGKKNAELEQFTYTVSHDLKSPLVTINGFLGYLEQDALSGNMERLKKDALRIQDAVHKMQRLLNELLELSRIGRLMNASETIPFKELVQEALEIVHGRLEERGVVVHIQPDLPAVYGDRPRLVEVVQNLLDNAAKYMGGQERPRIEVGQRGEENRLPIYYVRDNGIGIAPEHHERIFGLFNKLDARSEGTGVGLALVKRIVEVHGGRIWVESEAGAGSTFLFTFPSPPAVPQ